MDASADSPRLFTGLDDAAGRADPVRHTPTRGGAWVLRWTAAVATLVSAAAVLVEFGYVLAAEQTLARAARAGVLEATLPRATFHSVEETVRRRLQRWEISSADLRVALHQNGAPVRGRLVAMEGDEFSLALAVPSRITLPAWLQSISMHWNESQIAVRAERQMPGARLSQR